MEARRVLRVVIALAMFAGAVVGARAAECTPSNVPPTLEIEVLDPNADPRGRPAVEFSRDKSGNLLVDIPPAVLVHRYYYTGDRSFQAQLLPGGPSIVVANHPKTGERCYISVQMLPGAPRVTYTSHGIEYDFGQNGITVHFPWIGKPSVKYRSGQPWSRKIGQVVHAEHWKETVAEIRQHTAASAEQCKTCACGALVETGDAAKQVLLPVTNLVQVLPFGKVVFATNWEERLTIRAAEHERDHANKKAQHEAERQQYSLRTIR